VRELLDQLAVPDGRCLVTVNGELVQKEEFESRTLTASDKVVLMAPLAAG